MESKINEKEIDWLLSLSFSLTDYFALSEKERKEKDFLYEVESDLFKHINSKAFIQFIEVFFFLFFPL